MTCFVHIFFSFLPPFLLNLNYSLISSPSNNPYSFAQILIANVFFKLQLLIIIHVFIILFFTSSLQLLILNWLLPNVCPCHSPIVATGAPPPKPIVMTSPPCFFHLQLVFDQFECKQFQQYYIDLLTRVNLTLKHICNLHVHGSFFHFICIPFNVQKLDVVIR